MKNQQTKGKNTRKNPEAQAPKKQLHVDTIMFPTHSRRATITSTTPEFPIDSDPVDMSIENTVNRLSVYNPSGYLSSLDEYKYQKAGSHFTNAYTFLKKLNVVGNDAISVDYLMFDPVFGFLTTDIFLQEYPGDVDEGKKNFQASRQITNINKDGLKYLIDNSPFSSSLDPLLKQNPELVLYLSPDPQTYVSIRENLLRKKLPDQIIWGFHPKNTPRTGNENFSKNLSEIPFMTSKLSKFESTNPQSSFLSIGEKGITSDNEDARIDLQILYSALLHRYAFDLVIPENDPSKLVLFVKFAGTPTDSSNKVSQKYYMPRNDVMSNDINTEHTFEYSAHPFLPCIFDLDALDITAKEIETFNNEGKSFAFAFFLLQTVLETNTETGIDETLWRYICKNEQHFISIGLKAAAEAFLSKKTTLRNNPYWKVFKNKSV